MLCGVNASRYITNTMNEHVIDGLKQFIAATVSQSTTELAAGLAKLSSKVDGLETKVDRLKQR